MIAARRYQRPEAPGASSARRLVVACLAAVAALTAPAAAAPAGASASVGYYETHTQAVDTGNTLNGVSCVEGTTTCVATAADGDSFYSTNVSATAGATWTSWAGPGGQSPAEAVACPSTTLCVLADGSVAGGGGGNVYRASSLGGSFLTSFTPANGVNGLSCPSTSFCVATQEREGFIRYSTKPSGATWTALSIGTGAMKAVSCLSASFCAVVDDSGHVHVATTEEGVKEESGWRATDVDGSSPLLGIACTSTSACLAVDGTGDSLDLTIAPDGEATASSQQIEGAGELIAVGCAGATCATADNGALFASTDAGADWTMRYSGGAAMRSVSFAFASLCTGVTAGGEVVTFNPATTVPPLAITTGSLPAGQADSPYEAEAQAGGGEPPYEWSASGLPPGLSIDPASGLISGTPMSAVCVSSPCPQPPATYTPSVTVIDANGTQASEPFTIALRGTAVKLTAHTAGTGSKEVDSSPAGIGGCGEAAGSCEASFEDGTAVTLSATVAPGSKFAGWSGGGCSGTGTCRVTLSADTDVTANFTATPPGPPPASPPAGRPPGTKIARAKIDSRTRTATFRFKAIGTATAFQCKLTGPRGQAKFKACSRPRPTGI